MTTSLFSFLLTAGSDRMAQIDPHGWTLTLISVSVVFAALIILYFVYTLSGGIFSGKFSAALKRLRPKKKPKAPKGGEEAEIAAAIAMALEAELGSATQAAIATALHLYLSDAVHDVESGIITIRTDCSGWKNHSNFRKSPR